MANLIENDKIFYTPYEPKVQNRFILTVDGIPSFVTYSVVYVPHTSDNTAPENGWAPPSTVTVLTVSVYAL